MSIALAGPFVAVRTLVSSDSTSAVFIGIGTLFPLVVTAAMIAYLRRYYRHESGGSLLLVGAAGSVLLTGLFAVTALSIIWGQRTLGIAMEDPLILVTEMAMGGAIFGLIFGHFYGLSLVRRRRLRAQTAELQHQNERLDEFASVVSHDLRNPLSVAQGRLDLATDEIENRNLDAVSGALDRMEALIEDLLALAKAEQSATEVRAVGLEPVVDRSWGHVETGDATLVSEAKGSIRADPGRLQQLFENLFRNAVEHAGESVTVTVGELDEGFFVVDDGPGIPEENHEDVLESGFSTSADGTGFGLAIVAEIARSHDWDLSVTEGEDGGARIEVTGAESANQ